MTTQEYLEAVLYSQTLEENSDELDELRQCRNDVEELLRTHFEACSPTIRYGGSYAKGTLIKDDYDLDVICYFPHDDTSAGLTLKDIYFNTRDVLAQSYLVEEKPSALRLKSKQATQDNADFHIDVVPGRYIDDKKSDTFLYQNNATDQKGWLKTNLKVHLFHISKSDVVPAIRLMKLWRGRNKTPVKTFALELLTVKLLQNKKKASLEDQLKDIWTELRDNANNISIEDPANPTGNDLSDLLNQGVRVLLSLAASATLTQIEQGDWEQVFGLVEKSTDNAAEGGGLLGASFVSKENKPAPPKKPENPPKPPHPPGPDKPPKPPKPREVGLC